MRLIDADALIRAYIVDNANDDAEVISRYDVNCAPTIDAVEVVRCKDCEHSCKSHSTDYLLCEVWETPTGTMARVNPMGYCYEATQKGEVYE